MGRRNRGDRDGGKEERMKKGREDGLDSERKRGQEWRVRI